MKKKQISLNNPAVTKFFEDVFPILINESDRGAVLLAVSQIDIALEEALKSVSPPNMTQKKLKQIFDYSGPLGTLAARTSMAYFFRIINKDVCDAVHCLRQIRNKVSHECKTFSFESCSDDVEKFYDFGSNIPETVNKIAIELMMKSMLESALEIKDPRSSDESKLFKEPKEILEYLQRNPKYYETFEKELPKWKLAIGTALICGLLYYGAGKMNEVLGQKETF